MSAQVDLFGAPIEAEPAVTVEDVWAFWLREHAKMAHNCYALTPKRKKKIRQALQDFPAEVVLAAIEGVKKSDFHMGKNSRNRTYTNIETILRDAETIERHAAAVMVEDDPFAGCPLEARPGESWDEFNERRRAWRASH